MLRKCEQCGEEFRPARQHPNQRFCSRTCKDKHRRENNREKIREYNHQWRKANPDYGRCYREVNREELKELDRQWRKANPEKVHAKARRYREANSEKIRERHRQWREANPDKIQHYREANPDKIKAGRRRWKKANPEKVRLINRRAEAKRRAIKRNNGGSFTAEEFTARCEQYNWQCVYCGCKLDISTVEVDHVIPISHGGNNYISNIVPACKSCNSAKKDKIGKEFEAWLKKVGNVDYCFTS